MKKAIICLMLTGLFTGSYYISHIGLAAAQRPTQDGNRSAAAVKVITQAVKLTNNDRIFKAVGTGRARLSAGIYPSVSDEVIEVKFDAQQRVKKGDVLVQLDDRQEKLAVKLAEVELRDAKSLLQRYEQAVKEGAVPESEVDNARANYEAAQLALERAKLDLEDRQVRAPFEGYVGISNIDPGDRVGPDTLITGLDNRDILHVDFEVPEALIGALQEAKDNNHAIIAKTPAYLSMSFLGKISALDNRVDPERRTLMVRASIDNKDDLLRPGMSFETDWKIPGEKFPTVPEIALQWARGGSFVWIIREGKAEKVEASVISRKAGLVLLDGDLSENDQVVVEGVQRLRPGEIVETLGG